MPKDCHSFQIKVGLLLLLLSVLKWTYLQVDQSLVQFNFRLKHLNGLLQRLRELLKQMLEPYPSTLAIKLTFTR